ncbi:MAG: histidine phosphatase family protein [Candidatus Pacebacteria bacterium]|nr:histidine phosphatase family protein [Candidatus Paceibacterota bacterium]
MELYLFRHGEIEDKNKFIGHTDSELTIKGKKQNLFTKIKIQKIKVDAVFSSNLKRTFIDNAVNVKNINEINFGLWEGLSWYEIEEQFPKLVKNYLNNPLSFHFPNGENFDDFKIRVLYFINNLKENNYKKVALITHKGVIQLLLNHFQNKDFWDIKISYGEMIKLNLHF